MAIIKCPECGHEVSDKADKCTYCGFPVYLHVSSQMEDIKCEYCGADNKNYTNFCISCGAALKKNTTQKNNNPTTSSCTTSQDNVVNNIYNTQTVYIDNGNYGRYVPPTNSNKKNKWIAFLLCFFLGYFGAHKFYEGKHGMGIVYIFTAGLFGIGWIVDCIVLLCKPDTYYV